MSIKKMLDDFLALKDRYYRGIFRAKPARIAQLAERPEKSNSPLASPAPPDEADLPSHEAEELDNHS